MEFFNRTVAPTKLKFCGFFRFWLWKLFPKKLFPKKLFPKKLFPKKLFPKKLFPKKLLPKKLFPKKLFPKKLFPKKLFPIVLNTNGNDNDSHSTLQAKNIGQLLPDMVTR